MLTEYVPQRADEDLGYPLGWICGASLLVGVIVGAIAVTKGRRRRAFQAFLQPAATIATIVVFILLLGALEALTGPWRSRQDQESAFYFVILVAITAPLAIQYILQKLKWPAVA